MSYALEISEVGPAEYPLMAVLRETIFAECDHGPPTSLEADLEGRSDIHALIAHLEGNPVGFKIGYRFGPGVYYGKAGGVLREYRRQGLARRMQEWQHGFARSRGYRSVFFNSFNHFKPMMQLGLRGGFVPFGIQRRDPNLLAVQFAKELTRPADAPPKQAPLDAADIHIESVGSHVKDLIADMNAAAGPGVNKDRIDPNLGRGPDAATLVAFVDGQPAALLHGGGVAASNSPYVCRLIETTAPRRGRGIEAALLKHASAAAGSMGYAAIRLEARHDDAPTLLAALELDFDFTGILDEPRARQTLFVLERTLPVAD